MAETKDLVIEWWLVAMVCGCEGRKRGCDIVPDSIHFLYSLALGNSISTCNRQTDRHTHTDTSRSLLKEQLERVFLYRIFLLLLCIEFVFTSNVSFEKELNNFGSVQGHADRNEGRLLIYPFGR